MQSEIRNLIPSWEGQRGGLTVSASDRNPPCLSGTPPKEGIKLNTLLNPYSLASWVAQSTKPVALVLGLHWFKQNAPKAISDWLYSQVSSRESLPPEPPVPTVPSEHLLESHFTELQRLRARVRWLSGLSIGMIVMLIGVVSH